MRDAPPPFASAAKDITAAAHWRVVIHPNSYQEGRVGAGERRMREVVEKTRVSLRGCSFPCLPPCEVSWREDTKFVGKCLWSKTEFAEVWKLCRSGLFVGVFRLRELDPEYDREIRQITGWKKAPGGGPPGVVAFGNLVWSITEFFEFASRLARHCGFEEGVTVKAALRKVESFGLGTADFRRSLGPWYQCREADVLIERTCNYAEIASQPHKVALGAILELVESFRFENPRVDVIQGLQKELYSLRIGEDRVDASSLRWEEGESSDG